MRLHHKQESWNQVCKDSRPSREYFYKYDVFAKIKDILRVIKKSSLRGDDESKPYF